MTCFPSFRLFFENQKAALLGLYKEYDAFELIYSSYERLGFGPLDFI